MHPLIVLLVILAPAPAIADEAAVKGARARLEAYRAEHALPAVSAAIGRDGEVVWAGAVGFADLEAETPATAETRFRIGSVSKTLTAALVGRLLERGALDLDRPVREWLPDYPEKRWPMTPRQLGGHLAGVRHYAPGEFLWTRHYDSVREGLEMFEDDPLRFEPGTRYAYSSHGYNLLSAVLEVAGGDDFLTLMQREVFDPLDLERTVADHADREIEGRAGFYHLVGGAPRRAPDVDLSHKWAGGGFLSTPTDLVRFGRAWLADDYLSAETRRALWTSQRTSDGKETGYGIGWRARRTSDGLLVGHGGGSVGGRTEFLVLADRGVVVAVTVNCTQAPELSDLARALASERPAKEKKR